MKTEGIERVVDYAWEVFRDLPKDTKLELQKLKRRFINQAQWKAQDIENQKRNRYI